MNYTDKMLRRLKRKSNCCYRWRKWLGKAMTKYFMELGAK
jgi:hypothetical protein